MVIPVHGGCQLQHRHEDRCAGWAQRLPVKTLGLSLEEIQGCLTVHDAGDLPCGNIHRPLERQIERIDLQIRELGPLRQELQGLLAGWQSDPAKQGDVICPNLQV